jgi:hypothetical protein
MGKKHKSPHWVKPVFKIGETVLFRGERRTIERISGLDSGNRPRYRMVGIMGSYPETFIKKIEEK